MKLLFQSGNPITQDNLNTALLGYGAPGVISGSTVYYEANTNSYYVSSGIAKFSDGMLVIFDGTDKVEKPTISDGTFYLYVSKSNGYSEIVFGTTPTYLDITLAKVILSQNTSKIENVVKSVEDKYELSIFDIGLSGAIYDSSIPFTLSIDNTLKTRVLKVDTNQINTSIYFPFIKGKSNVKKLTISGSIGAEVSASVDILVDGVSYTPSSSRMYYSATRTTYSIELGNIFDNVAEDTPCSVKINLAKLASLDAGNVIKVYSLRLSNF